MKIQRQFGSLLLASLLASLITPAQAAAPSNPQAESQPSIDLGSLLNGVEQQCQYNEILESFWRALDDSQGAKETLPSPLKKAAGSIQRRDEVDFWMFTMPLHGLWYQLPINRIQFGLGKGNGIHVLLVEFAAPVNAVREVFSPMVKRSQQAMALDPDNTLEATTELVIEGDTARLICDLST